jgi:hypothetical protein
MNSSVDIPGNLPNDPGFILPEELEDLERFKNLYENLKDGEYLYYCFTIIPDEERRRRLGYHIKG